MTSLIYSVLPKPRRSMVTVHPDVSVQSCLNIMVSQGIGALVVKDGDILYGIASERDLINNCFYKELDPKVVKVSEVLCSSITILDINEPIEKAMKAITTTKRRHILVSEQQEVIAILSIGDLLYYVLEVNAYEIEALKKYIESGGTCETD